MSQILIVTRPPKKGYVQTIFNAINKEYSVHGGGRYNPKQQHYFTILIGGAMQNVKTVVERGFSPTDWDDFQPVTILDFRKSPTHRVNNF